MRDIREILKNLSAKDFENNVINLHIHTTCSDGKSDSKDVLKMAKERGYKLISITDHNTVEAHRHIQDEILVSGVEFDCWFGCVFIHLLAYGIDINNEELMPFMAKTKSETEGDLVRLFAKREVSKLIKAIHNAGGVVVLAHPACYWAFNLEKLVKRLIDIGLDGIEVYYPYPRFRKYVKFHSAKEVRRIADKYTNLIKTGGTDFHGKV